MPSVKATSAGLLAFRRRGGIEVLLAHPGGPYWAGKDEGVWTIPKGVVEPGDDLVTAARREFREETNLTAGDDLVPLAPVRQKGGKIMHAFAFEADLDLTGFGSNTFDIVWPPKSGQSRSFPEIDRISYFALATAKTKILTYQLPFLHEIERKFG
jgi:predicted NUDIX family NTP pyrophosphohydrolase